MSIKNLKEVVAGLTVLEFEVYKALIKCYFASGINNDGSDGQTDLRETLITSKVHPSQFAGILGSLAKKGLYQNVPWDGDYNLPYKTVVLNGRREKVRTDIGSVIFDDEMEKEFTK